METWETVQLTLDYIEDNLDRSIALETLAEMAHLSPFYFQKLFHRLVGKPVMEYVKLRRLANAAEEIRTKGGKILDIALAYGFNNHETFTRSFKETYGITPEAYRAEPLFLTHFIKPDISLKYRLIDEGVPLVAQGIVLEINRIVMEKDRYFCGMSIQNPVSDTPGIDFLGELWRLHHEKLRPMMIYCTSDRTEVGISSAGESEGHFTYFAGSEVSKLSEDWVQQADPHGKYENRVFVKGDYLVCTFSAENFYLLTTEALNKARDYLFGTWLPKHSLGIEPIMIELYDARSFDKQRVCEMDILLKILS